MLTNECVWLYGSIGIHLQSWTTYITINYEKQFHDNWNKKLYGPSLKPSPPPPSPPSPPHSPPSPPPPPCTLYSKKTFPRNIQGPRREDILENSRVKFNENTDEVVFLSSPIIVCLPVCLCTCHLP